MSFAIGSDGGLGGGATVAGFGLYATMERSRPSLASGLTFNPAAETKSRAAASVLAPQMPSAGAPYKAFGESARLRLPIGLSLAWSAAGMALKTWGRAPR